MKKIFSVVASIISLVILEFHYLSNSNSEENISKYFSNDKGILSIMYHRFNENKYPSTNIRMEIFKEHMKIIKSLGYEFYNPKLLINEFNMPKNEKKILITIDDGFKSFYDNAWPYLKKNKIPFILFVSTEPVGKRGYMNWNEIKEIDNSDLGYIGHHSHSHDYLIDMENSMFKDDIERASEIFKEELGYVPDIFSYPFGEFSLVMKNYISENFKLGFGQHSGVIDINKDKFELPRFPINEKYGELKRFKSLINYFPLEYKSLSPEDKKINSKSNPPKILIEFFPEQRNLKNITCYSNDGGSWKKTDLKFKGNNLVVNLKEPYLPRRGRINCSLNDKGKWRWFGTQFIVDQN